MLLARLFCYIKGYVIITISGAYPERFLNVCAARHILIWDVFSCSETMFKCSVSMKGFRLLPPIARKTGVRIKILEKRGLPMFFLGLKKRKWFVAGFLLCICMLVFFNQFVWRVEIFGCENVSASYVKEKLENCGLSIGTFRHGIDEKKLQTDMLIQTPELAWLWIDKSGSRVTVQVKERAMPPAIYDRDNFCNLVASKSGVIHSTIIKDGTPMIKIGDTVQKGDILVSGLILSEKGVEPRKVQSDGKVYARVWYEKTKAFSLEIPIKSETGRREKKYTLKFFGWELPLFLQADSPYKEFETREKNHELSLFGFNTGIGFRYTEIIEQNIQFEKQTQESIIQAGSIQLLADIDEEASADATLSNKQIHSRVIDEETVEVTVVAEYLENIAEKVFLP